MTNEESLNNFEATYATPMHCDGCTKEISKCLSGVNGIKELKFDVEKQILSVNGTVAPSSIINALQTCGRDAIIRGAGKPNSSAVSILETHEKIDLNKDTPVRGLARIVEVSENCTFFDITLNGVEKAGKYWASIHETGDVSGGPSTTGDVWYKFEEPIECNSKSDIDDRLYSGKAFLKAPLNVWQLIARSFVVTANKDHEIKGSKDSICGVIARSAGIWENDKQVCACSGKTIWQERKEALQRNIK